MSKRILATLCVTLFIISVLASVSQVSAHYTLGDQKPTSIGETNAAAGILSGGLPWVKSSLDGNTRKYNHVPPDWQGHVPGHIAYVLPGSLYVPPSDQYNYYSPNGSVLVDTVGDLRFYICVSDDLGDGQTGPINISWRLETSALKTARGTADPHDLPKYLYIAIPPEFTPPVDWARGSPDLLTLNRGDGVKTNVETSITNDYNMIYTGKFQPNHPVAPNWWFVRITATPIDFPQDQVPNLSKLNGQFDPKYTTDTVYKGNAGFLYPPNMDPWLDRQMRSGDFKGCYLVKINNMKAPSIAGKYFFKIFYTSTKQPFLKYTGENGWPCEFQAPGQCVDPLIGYVNKYFEKYDTIPPENYPVLLVKGEVDPGYITGRVRYCGHSSYYYGYYYGSGVHTSGKVVAEGTAIDPVTNKPLTRKVSAVGYFLGQLPGQGVDWKDRDTGSEGLYEIEGLAPGIYTLTAYAAGFVPRTLATQITVKAGQSISGVDIYVCPTAKLQTKVYSKCPTGPVDWPDYVTLETPEAWDVILPVVPGGADVRGGSPVGPDGIWYWFTEGATTVQLKDVWGTAMSLGITPPQDPLDTIAVYQPPTDRLRKIGWAWQELLDANGTVVAWQDFTFDIEEDKRSFGTFWGDPSCYSGIETGWDGHVPTFLADFTSGILPGTYRVRTWVFGYVQTKEYTVTFPAVEFPGSQYVEMDLYKGGTIDTTVHFHNQEMPSATEPVAVGNGWLLVEAVDANNVVQAWNSTTVSGLKEVTLRLIGESNAWKYFGRIHGMPEGTYTLKAYVQHYVQQEFPQHTVQYCTSGSMSFHMVRGAMIKTTIYSRDCQDPSQPVKWVHAGEAIFVDIITSAGTVYHLRGITYQDPTVDSVTVTVGGSGSNIKAFLRRGAKPSGLPTDVYRLKAYTPGYVQLQVPEVWAQKGSSLGDIPIYLLVGPEIRVVVDFKIELIPKPLPTDDYSYYFRIQAFDENGTLCAANITAVPQATWSNYAQSPWLGSLNPAQPDGVQTWVFQLFGFSPFTTPTNTPAWGFYEPDRQGVPTVGQNYGATFYGLIDPYFIVGYHDGTNLYKNYGIMWDKTYTIVVSVQWAGYTQLATVTATPTCKGITTVIFEMDRMGKIAGFVWTRNWMGDFRAASWLETSIAGAKVSKKAYTFDGKYSTFVTPDSYTIKAALVPPGGDAGYKSASRTAVVTWGGVTGGQDFYLEESGIPIPEFPAAGIMALISALAASLYLLRWRRNTVIPVR